MKKLSVLMGLLLLGAGLTACGRQASRIPQRETVRDFTQGFVPASETDALTRIQENDRFVLYANLKNGEAAVEDKKQGYTWYTNPADKQEDGLASGFNKNALLSVLTVEYSTDQNVNMTCGGYMSSVAKGGLSYRLEEDGSVTFLFDFPNESFRIPLRYALEEDRFVARVLTDGVEEYGANTVTNIDVLPFFGAGGTGQEGYMLVPDGSGALIYYNNNRLTANTYSKELYGFDDGVNDQYVGPSSTVPVNQSLSQNQYLPVFGVHQGDMGFLAVITGGDARTTIKANVAGKYTSYNTVWGSYKYRTVGTVRQIQKDGKDKAVGIAEKQIETWEDYEISFYFLERGRSGYAEMAACYRDYLERYEGLARRIEAREDIPVYLDLYGYIKKKKNFLGIPMDRKVTMTTVEDANGILDDLFSRDMDNVVVKYNYWMKNSFRDKIPTSAKSESRVGSRTEFLALQQRLEESGGGLYLAADLLNIYKTGNGVSKYGDLLQSAVNTAQNKYKFCLYSTNLDARWSPWNLLRPASVQAFYEKLTDNMREAGYHSVALDAIGELCYSELGTGGMGRNQASEVLRGAVQGTAQGVDVMLTGANGYAAAWASHIVNAPGGSSGYDIEDVNVPFYQMVFHGYVSYSLEAVNLCGNLGDMTLRCMEYGACPMYCLVGEENVDELIGSTMDHLYSADFRNWADYMEAQYRQLNEVLGGVQDSVITAHEILGGSVRKTCYENGVVIYVNYGKKDVRADGFVIQAKGYAAVEDGKILTEGTAAAERSGY